MMRLTFAFAYIGFADDDLGLWSGLLRDERSLGRVRGILGVLIRRSLLIIVDCIAKVALSIAVAKVVREYRKRVGFGYLMIPLRVFKLLMT